MIETSPIVPTESRIPGIPAFFNSPMDFSMKRRLVACSLTKLTQYTSNTTLPSTLRFLNCRCPQILIADDDPFQSYFYELFFQRTLDFAKLRGSKTDIQFEVFPSGEKLLQRFQQIKACGCGKTGLVISDYNMGEKKLNGIQVINHLRENGYREAVILRTAEEKEVLAQRHLEFIDMLNSKQIDFYVEKKDIKKIKEVVQAILKNMKE